MNIMYFSWQLSKYSICKQVYGEDITEAENAVLKELEKRSQPSRVLPLQAPSDWVNERNVKWSYVLEEQVLCEKGKGLYYQCREAFNNLVNRPANVRWPTPLRLVFISIKVTNRSAEQHNQVKINPVASEADYRCHLCFCHLQSVKKLDCWSCKHL